MIRRNGPQTWKNIHSTFETRLEDLIDVDNSVPGGGIAAGFELFNQAARDLDSIARDARDKGKRVRALGASWALTDIAVTDGWLINTKLLNGCFDLGDNMFEASYPQDKRRLLVLAQCGMSIAELNVHLEVTATVGFARALKTSGIGAGQTVAGSVSGNTHGSAVTFGATPDWVAGLHIVTGSGKSLWIERASKPVLNNDFVARLNAERIRDDDVFNAAVVSFGAFGVITAIAIETDPIYQLDFPPVQDVSWDDVQARLNNWVDNDPPGLYHYEFIYDPYDQSRTAMVAAARRVPFEPGHAAPKPVWIVRSTQGFALGDQMPALIQTNAPLSPGQMTAFQFKQYRERCILSDTRATPGQCFTATISYFEGNTETALGVSINDAARAMEICAEVIRGMKLAAISQVRVVAPSQALLSFTHLGPKTVVFEFGLTHNATYPEFENKVVKAFNAEGIRYTFHWSKNSGIDPQRLREMYGSDRVNRWKAARRTVFKNDAALMRVFENEHLVRAGLTT
ncbi:MAG TPA: FAD-binding protein [Longimicrobium sp.]|nr:FAD-binding protein [Longimicrobium sp.]